MLRQVQGVVAGRVASERGREEVKRWRCCQFCVFSAVYFSFLLFIIWPPHHTDGQLLSVLVLISHHDDMTWLSGFQSASDLCYLATLCMKEIEEAVVATSASRGHREEMKKKLKRAMDDMGCVKKRKRMRASFGGHTKPLKKYIPYLLVDFASLVLLLNRCDCFEKIMSSVKAVAAM